MPSAATRAAVSGGDLALEVDEVALGVGELALELARRHREQRGEPASLRRRRLDVLRDRPDRLHRRRDGERLAVAVEDPAAGRRHLEHAGVARLALLLQEIGLQRLQVDRRAGEHREGRQQRDQRRSARARPAGAPASAGWPRSFLLRPRRRLGRVRPLVTRRGSGARMPSVPVAIFSTRACRPQVLASSCSWPYSTSSARARACSRSSSVNSLRALCWEVTSPSAQATRTRRRRRFSFATRRARFGKCRSDAGIAGSACSCARPRAGSRCARAGWPRFRPPRRAPPCRRFVSGGCGISLARSGKSRGSSGCAQARRKRLTMRSSSEWKLITASRPPGAEQRHRLRQHQRHFLKLPIDENP